MQTRISITLILFGMIGLAFFLKQSFEPMAKGQSHHIKDGPDYAIRDFAVTLFNSNGIATQLIEGDSLMHYPDDDSIIVTTPKSQSLSMQRWHIRANKMFTTSALNRLRWTGEVHIEQQHPYSIHMLTPELIQFPYLYTANTDQGVEIRSGSNKVNSKFMHLDTLNHHIRLNDHVIGFYQGH